jgi:hypothetical protein
MSLSGANSVDPDTETIWIIGREYTNDGEVRRTSLKRVAFTYPDRMRQYINREG